MLRLTAYLLLTVFTVDVTAVSPCLEGKAMCENTPNRALVNGVWKCCSIGYVQNIQGNCICVTKVKGNIIQQGPTPCDLKKELHDLLDSLKKELIDSSSALQDLMKKYMTMDDRIAVERKLRDYRNSLQENIDDLLILSKRLSSSC